MRPSAARRRASVVTFHVAIGALAAGACAVAERPPQRAGVRVTIDTVGGVERVTNSGTPPVWQLEPVASLEGAGEEEFGRVVGVIGDSAGDVYVADGIAKRIYRFSPTGEYRGALGREGGGPGEFRDMRSLAWVGPYLATMDAGNARITTLTTDGDPGPAVRWAPLTGSGFGLEQTGPAEAYALLPVFPADRSGPSTQVFLRLTGDGVADTLPGRRPEPLAATQAIECMGGADGAIHFFSVPESSRPFATRAPGRRTLVGHTGEYRLAEVSAEGDTVRIVRRDLPNPPLSDSAWAVTDSSWTAFRERAAGARCTRSSIERPASLPAFADAFHDDAGRLWVEARDAAGYRFDVFDRGGALLGQLASPARDRSVRPYIRGGRLHYVAKDSLDVQTVRVARVVEAR